jgi:hypothetical protein
MTAQTILPANTLSSGFDVTNSLRFNDGDSPALTRSLGTTTLATKGTFSFWVKRGQLGTAQIIYSNEVADDNNRAFIQFEDDDTFRIKDTVSGSNTTFYATTQKFRDVGAWYHMVVALDSTEAGGDRIRIYKNGTRIPDANFGTSTEPNQNSDFKLLTGGQTNKNHIGKIHGGANHFDGYLAEFVYCDGQVLDASSFGEFDEDTPSIWKPISVSGLTMGDQGFYLDFEDSSALGNDKAGSNNFGTVTNLAATDQSTDTCTNNFATLNVLDGNLGNSTFSEGNLRFNSEDGANKCWMRSTIGVSSGKWYFEAKVQTAGNNCAIGISDRPSPDFNSTELGAGAFDYSYQSANSGNKLNNGSGSSYGDTYTDDDIVSCALDLDNNKVYFGKNGTFQNSGNPTNGTNPAFTITAPSLTNHGFYFFCLGDLTGVNNVRWLANFGSPPYSESGGNSDGNGYGNFAGSVPSGYYALNTKNLAEYG